MAGSGEKVNVEIKARCESLDEMRRRLLENGAVSRGVDHQTDTYFVVPRGRLKVRQGTIENTLISYTREDKARARPSDVTLAILTPEEAEGVREILEATVPRLAQVVKEREIFFAGNVKFHLDRVDGLGTFVEIEAQGEEGDDREALHLQTAIWTDRLGISDGDLVGGSYSSMVD